MKFPDVEIENFLAIVEAKFSLDDKGLVHVFGENNSDTSADSNGSGKSSLGDAINWCLWGETAREESGDNVVHTAALTKRGVGTRVSTQIYDDDADALYRVDRYRKYPKHKNELHLFRLNDDGTEAKNLTKGKTSLTQALIERILGCSKSVFEAAVYSGQEKMPDIPKMTDKQLKMLVEEASGVDILSNAHTVARDEAREAAQKLADAQIKLDRCIDARDSSQTHLERTQRSADAWDIDRKERLENETDRAKKAVALFKAEQKDFADKKIDADALKEERTQIEDRIGAVHGEQVRERVLQDDLKQAEAARSKVQNAITLARQAHERAQKNVDDAKAAVARRKQDVDDICGGVGEPCDECGQPLLEEHLDEAIDRADKRVIAAKEKMVEANVKATDTLEALEQVKKKLPRIETLVGKTEKALADHRDAMTDISAEQQSLKDVERKIDLDRLTRSELQRMREQAEAIAERAKAIKAEKNPHRPLLDEIEKEIAGHADKIDAAAKDAAVAKEEAQYADAVVDVFAPKGVRAHRLDEVTPYLNERTAHYLGSLSDGAITAYWTTLTEKADGDLAEKFSIVVERDGGAPSFKSLSGGEKRKVRLSCALALQDLVSTRASKSIDLFIGDEIDDALDASGLERLMGILEEKARERGTVLIISHSDIGHYARQTMIVRKTNDAAEVIIT